jgi:hypothetical protein
MRFLGVGEAADLAALYLRLAEDGNEVKVFIGFPLCKDTLAGLIERVADWQAELDWVRAAGPDGCILFENVGQGYGEIQDRLRREGFNVIGSSAYGTRLENDRAYAQRVLADLGLATTPVFEFSDVAEAKRFISERPARYVLKSNGADAPSFVGRHMAGDDMAADDFFDLPGVPWVSYFHWWGVSIHGTYWHNDYGRPRSHGCVNLRPEDAKWVFRWTTPRASIYTPETKGDGTAVIVTD